MKNLLTLLFLVAAQVVKAQRTPVDVFVPQLRIFEDIILEILQPPSQINETLRRADKLNKLQPRISEDIPFPCSVKNGRSRTPPKIVDRVRPGDIDVIGAVGDSLVAGNGLLASNIFDIVIQNRGLSFAIGGQGTWRRFVTLPNILKEFNPNLFGYSVSTSFNHHGNGSKFNLAEGGAMSRDIPYMSEMLVKRMKNDPKVDIERHWKMISIMIGCNDFCSNICHPGDLEKVLTDHRRDLVAALRILKQNLPRTIVNLIVVPHLREIIGMSVSNQPPICYFTRNLLCSCLFGLQFRKHRQAFDLLMTNWQKVQIETANDPEFDAEDFTVIAQPYSLNYKLPRLQNGLSDYTAMSEDCFHLSQKENARAATSLWNNIMEPVGRKTTHPGILFQFRCPTKNKPYIFTKRNSF